MHVLWFAIAIAVWFAAGYRYGRARLLRQARAAMDLVDRVVPDDDPRRQCARILTRSRSRITTDYDGGIAATRAMARHYLELTDPSRPKETEP